MLEETAGKRAQQQSVEPASQSELRPVRGADAGSVPPPASPSASKPAVHLLVSDHDDIVEELEASAAAYSFDGLDERSGEALFLQGDVARALKAFDAELADPPSANQRRVVDSKPTRAARSRALLAAGCWQGASEHYADTLPARMVHAAALTRLARPAAALAALEETGCALPPLEVLRSDALRELQLQTERAEQAG